MEPPQHRRRGAATTRPKGRATLLAAGLLAAGLVAAALAAGLGPPAEADEALYRSFGGHEGLTRIVDDATQRWVADDRIKDTFDDINLDRFKRLLVDQICQLTGGPCQYKGRDMYHAHKGLRLDNAQFNALVEDLQSAMDKEGIPFWTQNRLLVILAPMQRDVVTR